MSAIGLLAIGGKSILLPGVFLFVLLLASSLRAETYTVIFDGDDPDAPQEGTLRWAIAQANAHPGSTININYNVGAITFAGQSPIITAPVTINGNWNTVSGNGAERIFFIDMPNAADAVRINNVTLADGYAKGGDGGLGSGGGGLGAGGAIFVNRGAVTISNVSFTGNSAEGGKGGAVLISSGAAASGGGGGGGLGGNGGTGRIFGVGGDSGGGGGYGGNGGDAGSAAGGGGGLVGNGGSGLWLTTGHKGGGGGGGLGDGGNAYEKDVWAEPQGTGVMGGTGGSGGGGQGGNTQFVSPGANGSLYGGGGGAAYGPTYTYDPGKSPSNGGNGGKFGGGGGAVETLSGGQSNAGDGGDFGGGGGNPSSGRAGNGGFGGGGGGSSYNHSSGQASSGNGVSAAALAAHSMRTKEEPAASSEEKAVPTRRADWARGAVAERQAGPSSSAPRTGPRLFWRAPTSAGEAPLRELPVTATQATPTTPPRARRPARAFSSTADRLP